MMKTAIKHFAVLGFGLLLLGACSKKPEAPKGLFFSGRCKVEVRSEPKDSQIFVDGINVGSGEARVELPCGEKQILVKKPGFKPYYAYHPVDSKRSLKVTVNLSHLEHSNRDFALSEEIVDQIREGQKIWDPSKGPRSAGKDEGYPAYLGDMNALLASVKGVAATGAAGAGGFEEGTWDKVDDWR